MTAARTGSAANMAGLLRTLEKVLFKVLPKREA